jgi:drug/metabolite transporter, DME family
VGTAAGRHPRCVPLSVSRRVAPLAVLAAAVLWGTSGAAQELGAPHVAPPAVAALRSLVGGLVLLAATVGFGRHRRGATPVRSAFVPLTAASLAITVFQVGYFGGIRLNGVAVGTLLAIGSAPVWAGLLSSATGRRPDLRWAAATAVTVVGTALLVLPGGEVRASAVGVLASLGAGFAYAAYTVASKRALDHGIDGVVAMAAIFVCSGLLLSPALLVWGVGWAATPSGAATVAWLGLGTIALAYALFAAGLRHVDAPTATTLTLAEPLTATVVATILLREVLGPVGLAGAALVTAGLALAGRRQRAHPRVGCRPAGEADIS